MLVWALNYIALIFSFYWTLGWYDYMMHFLGGLTVGVLFLWCLGLEDRSLKSFLVIFILVLTVGISWEIFEYANDLTFSTESYKSDTIHDLVMDIIGTIVAYLSFTSKRPRVS